MLRSMCASTVGRLTVRPSLSTVGWPSSVSRIQRSGLQLVLRNCTSRFQVYDEATKEDLDTDEKAEMRDLVDRYFHTSSMAQQVLIIQPFISSGPKRNTETTSQLMLDESRALVSTLDWKVADEMLVGLSSYKKKFLFGSGKLDQLRDRVESNCNITAVFLSRYQLTAVQRIELEDVLRVPIIDRYTLVLQIFFQHARSQESKLQVALAELPYLKNRLIVQHQIESHSKGTGGNIGEQYFDKQKFVLKKIENNIKRKIENIKLQRNKLRESRKKNEVLTVAVIGYTNCGKTSLIKSLTNSVLMEPKDKLFATLEVTCHGTRLPDSNLEVVFIDTVGFISDIPTPLIASFSSTLEDALQADLLLHVRDFSHPDHVYQNSQVLDTLRRLKVSEELLTNMLTVGNKIDRLPRDQWRHIMDSGALPLSATQGFGLDLLVSRLTRRLVRSSGRLELTVRVRPGSLEWEWLRQHGTVSRTDLCPKDQNFYLLHVLLTRASLDRFTAKFVTRAVLS